MRSKSATVIAGFSSGLAWSALIACILALVSSSEPVRAVLAKPKPDATSPKDSIPRLAAAGMDSKKPTSSGRRPRSSERAIYLPNSSGLGVSSSLKPFGRFTSGSSNLKPFGRLICCSGVCSSSLNPSGNAII